MAGPSPTHERVLRPRFFAISFPCVYTTTSRRTNDSEQKKMPPVVELTCIDGTSQILEGSRKRKEPERFGTPAAAYQLRMVANGVDIDFGQEPSYRRMWTRAQVESLQETVSNLRADKSVLRSKRKVAEKERDDAQEKYDSLKRKFKKLKTNHEGLVKATADSLRDSGALEKRLTQENAELTQRVLAAQTFEDRVTASNSESNRRLQELDQLVLKLQAEKQALIDEGKRKDEVFERVIAKLG